MAKLKKERAKQIQNRFRAGQAWDGSMELVFTDELGRCLNAHSVYCSFKRVAEKIGAPAARFHDLRHSYAVLALRAGNSIKDVQDSLGHYSAAFTMDTYAFVTQQMQQEAADRMEAQIKALKQA